MINNLRQKDYVIINTNQLSVVSFAIAITNSSAHLSNKQKKRKDTLIFYHSSWLKCVPLCWCEIENACTFRVVHEITFDLCADLSSVTIIENLSVHWTRTDDGQLDRFVTVFLSHTFHVSIECRFRSNIGARFSLIYG